MRLHDVMAKISEQDSDFRIYVWDEEATWSGDTEIVLLTPYLEEEYDNPPPGMIELIEISVAQDMVRTCAAKRGHDIDTEEAVRLVIHYARHGELPPQL